MTPPAPSLSSAATWIGAWSRPPDAPALGALVLAGALLVLAVAPEGPLWLASIVDLANAGEPGRQRRFLTIASFFAAFLSLGYIAFYLRGGPRAPEASVYWVQGRAMSHGALAWTAPDPTACFRARALLLSAPERLAGVSSPGYPLLLAMGFLVGAPMLIGPLLAAAIVIATWWLAHEVVGRAAGVAGAPADPPSPWRDDPEHARRAETTARLAAGLSIVSAALRYHTSDALPEGAAALAVTCALASALRARRTGEARWLAAAGLAVGFLVAAHPAAALPVGIAIVALPTCAASANAARSRAARLAWTCAGALPGVLLLLAANRAATGHAFSSPAAAYASAAHAGGASVAPPAWLAAVRCVRGHLLDIANLEPIALLAVVPLVGSRSGGSSRRPARLLALVVAGQVVAQVLSLRGAGADASPTDARASLLVAVVPLEHVLVALGVARLSSARLARASLATLAAALAGFAVHAAHVHEAVARGGLGRPRFEPDVLREANVTHGLVFFDDDDGFELAHDPGVGASHGVDAARSRGDDHDRLLYDLLGHPQVHRYVATAASASLASWVPLNAGSETWRFEAENDWPPVAQSGGWAEAIAPGNGCASEGRVVRVSPSGVGEASVTLPLPVPPGSVPSEAREWMVTPRVVQHGDGGTGTLALVAEPGLAPLAEWSWNDAARPSTCVELPARSIKLGGKPRAWLVVRARGGPVMLDRTTLRPR
jgi:hypothetical protein